MAGLGAHAQAYADYLVANDPSISNGVAENRAKEVYDQSGMLRRPALTETAAAIYETYSPANALPIPIGTIPEQNQFLARAVDGKDQFVFGDTVVVRKARAISDEPGIVEVSIKGILLQPRGGATELKTAYRVSVCGKQSSAKPDAKVGAFLRKIAYRSNRTRRSMSHLLECLGPRQCVGAHNFGCDL